jgi:hypothetical protein
MIGSVRGPFPIPRSRRGLLVAGAALAVLLGGAAAGLTVALTGAGSDSGGNGGNGGNGGLTRASFAGYGFDFRYPSGWQREDWCWLGTTVFPLLLLTTAQNPPPCQPNIEFGSGTPLPPPQRIERDGVSAWWFASDHVLTSLLPNATLDGHAARITVRAQPTRRHAEVVRELQHGKQAAIPHRSDPRAELQRQTDRGRRGHLRT